MPAPPLITPATVALPGLPAALEGLRIAQVSDLHVRKPRRRHEVLLESLAATDCDLLLLLGDYMHGPGCESPALSLVERIVAAADARLGSFGVFGNHDFNMFRDDARRLPVRWLENDAAKVDPLPLVVAGIDMVWARTCVDMTETLLAVQRVGGPSDFVIMLQHTPLWSICGADAGVPLALAGHLHGGQVRLPGGRAIRNCNPWPTDKSSGIIRIGPTTLSLGRGLGESGHELARWFCPAHVPLLTLTRGDEPPDAHCRELQIIERW